MAACSNRDPIFKKVTLFSIQVACREYEAQLAATDPTADVQLQRVRQLYHRQLLVPLADSTQTRQSCVDWESSLPGAKHPSQLPSHIEQGFQKAQQAVHLRLEHEATVAPGKPADETLLASFLAYIKYEEVGLTCCSELGSMQPSILAFQHGFQLQPRTHPFHCVSQLLQNLQKYF